LQIFNEVFKRHSHALPKELSYTLVRSSAFDRVHMVYLYVKNPEDIFVLKPRIVEEVFSLWDLERTKGKA
jgi:hypothetical protein